MRRYLAEGVLAPQPPGLVLVERETARGRTRGD
jgi:hypothetical protein